MSRFPFRSGLAAAASLAAVVVAWRQLEPGDLAGLAPIFASPATLWSTLATFFAPLFLSGAFLMRAFRQQARERETIGFVGRRLEEVFDRPQLYDSTTESVAASGLLGDNEIDTRQRLRTSVGRVVAMLHHDSRFYRYEPVHLLVRSEATELSKLTARVSGFQTVAIRLGILGTFIGLITSLSQVQEVFLLRGSELANQPDATLSEELAGIRLEIGSLMGEVVQGLALAFGTSIAGIVAAILISFMAFFARRREREILAEIQGLGLSVQKFLRDRSSANEALVRTADELRTVLAGNLAELGKVRENIHLNTMSLAEASRTLGEGLAGPVQLFAENAGHLRDLLQQTAWSLEQARLVQAQLQATEANAAARVEWLGAELAGAVEAGTQALRLSSDESRKALATTLEAAATAVERHIAQLGATLVSHLADSTGPALHREVLTGLATRLDASGAILREAVERQLGEGRRQARWALALYAAGIAAVSLSAFAAPLWSASPAIAPAGETAGRVRAGEDAALGR